MDNKVLLALITSLTEEAIDNRLSQLHSLVTPERGPRGFRGVKGESFDFYEQKDNITELINTYIDSIKDTFVLKFSDLTEDEKNSLRGEDGKSVTLDDCKQFIETTVVNSVSSIRDDLKLKFSDLNEEELEQLKLKFSDLSEDDISLLRGPRGQRGKSGKSFDFDSEKEKILESILEIYDSKKDELKLKFSDLNEEELNLLKLKFSDLSDDEILSLRGPRGQRGKSGKSFDFDSEKDKILESILEIYNSRKDELKLKFSDLTDSEKLGLKGEKGNSGVIGPRGLNGVDGKDAENIIDIDVNQMNRDEFTLIFYFTDGTRLETPKIELPTPQNIYNQYITAMGGSGSGGISSINIEKDDVSVASTQTINFEGDNVTVTDEGTKVTVNVSQPDTTLTVLEDGVLRSDAVEAIDFVGDGFEVLNPTVMADWVFLSDVTPTIGDYALINGSTIQVKIIPQTIVESANFLLVSRVLDEDCGVHKLVSASSGTNVVIASNTVEAKSRVLGLTLEAGLASETVQILLFGNRVDPIFNFPLNKHLYLTGLGDMTDTPPLPPVGQTWYITEVAFSNGLGSVFINPKSPLEVAG